MLISIKFYCQAAGRKEPVRYLLWIRLWRAFRVIEFFQRLEKDLRIDYRFTKIVKLLVVELYCTHTAACIFYYLATTLPPSKEGYTWIGSLTMGDYSYRDFRHISLWKRYVTSLYFAIVTMVTVGKIFQYSQVILSDVTSTIFVRVYFVSFGCCNLIFIKNELSIWWWFGSKLKDKRI